MAVIADERAEWERLLKQSMIPMGRQAKRSRESLGSIDAEL